VVTYYSDASHTGIYVGDGMVVHSSTYGQPVRVVPLGAAGPVNNARRY
jgi:cell wall-associated NlpC family hydrolase